ncbi:hypothetical protein RJ035_006005 [Blastomyces gilchristii]
MKHTAILRELSTEVEQACKALFFHHGLQFEHREKTRRRSGVEGRCSQTGNFRYRGAAHLDSPVADRGKKKPTQYTWLVGGEGGLKGLKAPLPSDFREKGHEVKRTVNGPHSAGAWLPVCWHIRQQESAQHGRSLHAGPGPGAGAERSECDGSTGIVGNR